MVSPVSRRLKNPMGHCELGHIMSFWGQTDLGSDPHGFRVSWLCDLEQMTELLISSLRRRAKTS